MIGLNVAYNYDYRNGNTKDSILVEDQKDRKLDVSGVAKYISIQKEKSTNFVFYEFFCIFPRNHFNRAVVSAFIKT